MTLEERVIRDAVMAAWTAMWAIAVLTSLAECRI